MKWGRGWPRHCQHHRQRLAHTLSITRPGGRTLAYETYGPSAGTPLFYFHGTPGCRLEAELLAHFARTRKVRVIAPDRPGFGRSTYYPSRRITPDWPEDVCALATHLGVARFAILGVSGGGPYALACARSLPRDMLSGVGLLASPAPWEAAGREDGLFRTKRDHALVNWAPWLMRWLVRTYHGKEATLRRLHDAQETSPLTGQQRRGLEQKAEAFAQGPSGYVHELRLLHGDWGFRLEDVGYEGIRIWHGARDRQCPIRTVRWMAGRLRNPRLLELEGIGHARMRGHVADLARVLTKHA